MLRTSLLAVVMAACTGPAAVRPELCDNGVDDNADGRVDCLDSTCFANPVCQISQSEDCSNGVDDDANNFIDCKDSVCERKSCGSDCVCMGGYRVTGPNAAGGSAGGTPSVGGGTSGGTSSVGGGTSGGTSSVGGGTAGGTSSVGGGTAGGAALVGGGTSGGAASVGGGTSGGTSSTGGGTSGGVSSTGGGTSGGVSSVGGGTASAPERNCANNLDDDLDNATDCDDSDCVGITCGMGCTCALNRRTEVACSDGADNDGDTLRDCADPDCQGVGTEICNDGIDNTCDRAIDCGDSKCSGNASCTGVQDGRPCLASNQCASGRCLTEAVDGMPNGLCTNSVACSVSLQTGCSGGGRCVNVSGTGQCRMPCTGNGLSGAGSCRQGYACVDGDTTPSNNNNTCRALCSTDADCAVNGPNFGCNPWSKLCQNRDRGRGRYGDPCTLNTNCESEICLTGMDFPNGSCAGFCRADQLSCATDGTCLPNPGSGDNAGICYRSCSGVGTTSTCRAADNYKCWPISGATTACACLPVATSCGQHSDCCTNYCSFNTCICVVTGGLCTEHRECCSGTCSFGFCQF